MIGITKVSSKGQVVIPYNIRKDLGLNTGSNLVVSTAEDMVILKKVELPDPKTEFMKLAKLGREHAKKKGFKEKDVNRIIHKSRGVKVD
jgi:AbrB family looped-hinge helix DNA binding protein